MKIHPSNLLHVTLVCLVLFLNFSCNKDSDLLAEYVVNPDSESTEVPKELTIDLANAVFTTEEDQSVSFNLLQNTSSNRKGRRRYKSNLKPTYGAITIEKDSIAVYTPPSDYNGKDDIEITLEVINEDETTTEEVVTVDVTVEPVTDVVEDIVEVVSEEPVVIEPLKNDTFKEESVVAITEVSQPSNGTAIINEDNTITYIPNTNNSEEVSTEETITEEVITEEVITTEEDTFTYTTSVTNPDDTVSEETGSVTITNKTPTPTSEEPMEMGGLKAFPGAEGFGKNTTGGRGGAVVEVTNLNDSGSGSLREALLLKYPRTIVFRVGGNINLTSGALNIPRGSGDVTIAGQTAPGDGICIKGDVLEIKDSNVILRYLRIRGGDNIDNKNKTSLRIVSTSGGAVSNVIADHLSISWGADTNVSIGGIGSGNSVNNVTVQNSIISENISNGYNVLLWNRSTNITFLGNLLAHSKDRNIRSSTSTSNFEQVNNLLYSNKSNVQPTDENHFDVIGNVWITNPSVSTNNEIVRLQPCSSTNCPGGADRKLTKAYIKDNTLDGGPITISSNLNPYLQDSPIFNSGISYMPSSQVKEYVFANVGANLHRDSYDTQIINEVKNRTGSLNTSAPSSIYPDLEQGTPFIDLDSDGMEDAWEIANGLDPKDSKDYSKDRNGDGYTNLEEFLHYLTLK